MSSIRLFLYCIVACVFVVFLLYLRIQEMNTPAAHLQKAGSSSIQALVTHTLSRHGTTVHSAYTETTGHSPQYGDHNVAPVPPQMSTAATVLSEIMIILHVVQFLSPVQIERSLQGKPGSESFVLKLIRDILPEAKYDFLACSQDVAEDTFNLSPDFYNVSRNNMTFGFECTLLTDMHFIVQRKRIAWPITALASFPGSGNTWLRYLLEQVTGVFTGSQECDIVLKASGLLGEGVQSSNVLVVKTHNPSDLIETTPKRHFKAAVVLVRNPFDAILAEYHRMVLWSHIRMLEPDHFRHNFTQWNASSFVLLAKWKEFAEFWLGGDDIAIPKLVISYEDLVMNRTATLERVLRFLRVKYSDTKLNCVTGIDSSSLKRRHPQDSHKFYPFTTTQVAAVRGAVLQVSQYLDKYTINHVQWLHMAGSLGWDPGV